MTRKGAKFVAVRVEAFDQKTEFIAKEIRIAPIPVIELRRLAGFPDEFEYPVGGIDLKPEHLVKIRQWIDEALDADRYDIQFGESQLPRDFEEN